MKAKVPWRYNTEIELYSETQLAPSPADLPSPLVIGNKRKDMEPKTFIITGASKGIGAAITKQLLAQSHNVVLAARSAELLEAVKKSNPKQVEYVAGDLTDTSVCDFNS